MIRLSRLYAVADATFGDPVEIARELFDGGARLGQLVVNDRADIARIAGTAGVHLGQEDLPPSLAKQILADGQGVGYSTHNIQQALDADNAPVDYIAVGPVFSTSTKKDADPVLGLERLTEICSQVRKPVVAIGGITLESAHEVLECGAASVAVISDLLRHGNIRDRTCEWVRHLES